MRQSAQMLGKFDTAPHAPKTLPECVRSLQADTTANGVSLLDSVTHTVFDALPDYFTETYHADTFEPVRMVAPLALKKALIAAYEAELIVPSMPHTSLHHMSAIDFGKLIIDGYDAPATIPVQVIALQKGGRTKNTALYATMATTTPDSTSAHQENKALLHKVWQLGYELPSHELNHGAFAPDTFVRLRLARLREVGQSFKHLVDGLHAANMMLRYDLPPIQLTLGSLGVGAGQQLASTEAQQITRALQWRQQAARDFLREPAQDRSLTGFRQLIKQWRRQKKAQHSFEQTPPT